MKSVFVFALAQLALSAPIQDKRAFKEILMAHTNAAEFTKVHSVAGLNDQALFNSAHTPNAPAVPGSAAAGNVQKGGNIAATIGQFLGKVGGVQGVQSAIQRGAQAAGPAGLTTIQGVQQSLLAGVAQANNQQVPAVSAQGTPNTLALQLAQGTAPTAGGATAGQASQAIGGLLAKRQVEFFTADGCLTPAGLVAAQKVVDMGMNTPSFDQEFTARAC
ncbi:hypothetical protein HK103_007485 [Boothiomyces macroporosus]|uniref:Uncharacterized protein n=1 Tax=Boothiomyces macroporosus TaxID=261099 RepID=A0AAD5UC56_9FUNG|nr:hypothetical protein HK103_007485 [Boothiomyces macroporosus]